MWYDNYTWFWIESGGNNLISQDGVVGSALKRYALPGLQRYTWAYEIRRPAVKVTHFNYPGENEMRVNAFKKN